MVRRLLLGLFVAFGAIQFVPVERTNPPATATLDAPANVRAILERSCFDCHSHETRWPWYSRVAPVSWLVANDVSNGREELNFSTWDQYDARRAARRISDIPEEIEEGEMPLPNYLRIHPEAKVSEVELATLRSWAARYAGAESDDHEQSGRDHAEDDHSGHGY